MTCSCDKRAYPTRAAAHRVVLQLKAKGWRAVSDRGRLQTYHCEAGVWHVGNAPMYLVVAYRQRRAA